MWRRIRFAVVMVLPALAMWPVRADAAAEDPDDKDDPAAETLRVEVDYFDRQVFGGEGPEGPGAKRNRLDRVLRRETAAYEWPCALTAAQTQKLVMAGNGDIKRVFDRVEDMKRTFEKSAGAEVDINTYFRLHELAGSAQELLDSNPFQGESLFARTLRKLLTFEQTVRYESVRAIRRFGGKFQTRRHGTGELKEIDLSVSTFADEGMLLLAPLTNVQRLSLDSTRVTDSGLVHLQKLTGLQGLELGNTDVSDAGLAALRQMTTLETLNLRSTRITDGGLAHLRGLVRLRHLRLSNTRVTDAGLAYLKDLKSLEALYLGATGVSDAGLANLAGFTQLKELDLLDTRVTDAGLVHLAGLAHLEMLDLRNAAVTDAGLSRLRTLTNLKEIYLSGTEVSDAAAAELKQVLPRLTIYK